mgnify:CR=1 FL=1
MEDGRREKKTSPPSEEGTRARRQSEHSRLIIFKGQPAAAAGLFEMIIYNEWLNGTVRPLASLSLVLGATRVVAAAIHLSFD